MQEIKCGVPALNTEEYLGALIALAQAKEPTLFALQAKLPTQGRSDIPLAATAGMSVILKAYAAGGENELHAHLHEDHLFLVMQGTAEFFGSGNRSLGVLQHYQGILIPKGAYYRFEAGPGKSLVMLRIGAVPMLPDAAAAFARVDTKGRDMDGYSAENKEVPVLYEQEKWFPPR